MKKSIKFLSVISAIMLVLAMFSSCGKDKADDTTDVSTETESYTELTAETSVIPSTETIATTVAETTTEATTVTTTVIETTTATPTTVVTTTEAPTTANVISDTGWSKEQIATYLSDSINRTKALTSTVTAKHTESFSANVTQITGGDLAAKAANLILNKVITPTEETLVFNGSPVENSEGETVGILLPKNGGFTLSATDIASATAQYSDDNIVIDVTLNAEQVGLGEQPRINSAAVGYLDTSKFDISIFTISKLEINYTGSTIKVEINPNGYVISAEYTIPMHTEAAAKAMGISGTATFDGFETETWELTF